MLGKGLTSETVLCYFQLFGNSWKFTTVLLSLRLFTMLKSLSCSIRNLRPWQNLKSQRRFAKKASPDCPALTQDPSLSIQFTLWNKVALQRFTWIQVLQRNRSDLSSASYHFLFPFFLQGLQFSWQQLSKSSLKCRQSSHLVCRRSLISSTPFLYEGSYMERPFSSSFSPEL